jgi:hypothetical protein
MIKRLLPFAALMFFAGLASAQTDKPLKVRIVYDKSDQSSAAVGPLLAQMIAGQPKFFTIATGDDKDLRSSRIATEPRRVIRFRAFTSQPNGSKGIRRCSARLLSFRSLRTMLPLHFLRPSCKMSPNDGTIRIATC